MVQTPDDVRRIAQLLWHGGGDDGASRRGPRQRTSVAAVVQAAIALADEHGLAQLSMRTLAAQVGLKPMGLYTYVPNREALIALMVDAAAAEDDDLLAADGSGPELAEALRSIADQYRDELLRHPWLLDVPAWRPIPGPGSSRRYEQQLAVLSTAAERSGPAFDDIGLDAVIASLRAFATGNARSRIDQVATRADSGMTDAQWWEIAGPLLAEAMSADVYPVSMRVGATVGEAFAGPGNADHAYEYGLARLIDGIVADRR
ncbi:MAG: TetR/AcrR family transcriptional regulator C-terminal domain-containing protein [Gordonia sp. (in: high G+C Gram-positive bacteria)]|uniref:TetR/AcrR family transcriptional regulator n=1 Tax=Gordonia TaxID=2053 RepID=UPI003263489B